MIKTNNPNTLPSECQGYEIIFSYRVGENTHAIGHNPKKAASYVVWYYTPLSGFFWGKYADSFEKAMTFWGKYADSFEKAMTSLLERVRMGDIANLKNHGIIPRVKDAEDVKAVSDAPVVKDVRSISECKGCRFAHYTDSQKIFCGFCTKKILAEWRQEKAEREERAKEASGNGRSTENKQLYGRAEF